jgi:hypothetical protein
MAVEELTPKQINDLDQELGSAFAWGERLFGSFTEDDVVSLAWSLEPDDFAKMLADDGNAEKIARVLTLPVRGAAWHITGSGPEADLVRENVGPMMDRLIEQCTTAVIYRRTYFEKVWTLDPAGNFVYDKIAWRPPSSCVPRFDRKTGEEQGFYQRITDAGWWRVYEKRRGEDVPGQITIPRQKAFVYTHGRHREPVKGVSDLQVAYNAYKKKRKLKFLWAQYLENQSLPKIATYGRDTGDAQRNAQYMAQARASGIIPMVKQADMGTPWEIIESSGRGADQFIEAIRYYDWEQTNSVLAGFTELASSASGTGSYALSSDQSEFFLASEQALADEIADQIIENVFTPLATVNFGVDAPIPGLVIGPIGRQQTDRALKLLEQIVTATRPMVPYEFVGFLLNQVSESMGLDISQVAAVVEAWGERMQVGMEQALAEQAASAQASSSTTPVAKMSKKALDGLTGLERGIKDKPADTATTSSSAVERSGVNGMKAPARHLSKRDKARRAKT